MLLINCGVLSNFFCTLSYQLTKTDGILVINNAMSNTEITKNTLSTHKSYELITDKDLMEKYKPIIIISI